MEVLNSTSLGAMGSLIRKLDKLLHTDDAAQTIGNLRDGVVSIRNKLMELSEVHDPPLTVNYWMKDGRELSYDIEDCVDKFVHADIDSDTKMVWIVEILGFSTRVEEMMERYHRFKFEYVLSHPTVTKTVARHQIGKVPTNPQLVGMEGPKSELLRWLKPNGHNDESDLQLKVVSVVGVEGVGKSTLAQELWRILGEEFQCHAFVQASKKPDMRMLLRSILLQVRPNQPPEASQVPHLIHDISTHLQANKRSLSPYALCIAS